MSTYEEIAKANATITPIDIKGKPYVDVAQRIKAFRMVHPDGGIITELLSMKDGVCVIRATVNDAGGSTLGTGTAYEKEDSTFINKTSYIENCETSAVGRALGMAGFGIDASVCSVEEVSNAILQQEGTDTPKRTEKPSKADLKRSVESGVKMCAERYGQPEPLVRRIVENEFSVSMGKATTRDLEEMRAYLVKVFRGEIALEEV